MQISAEFTLYISSKSFNSPKAWEIGPMAALRAVAEISSFFVCNKSTLPPPQFKGGCLQLCAGYTGDIEILVTAVFCFCHGPPSPRMVKDRRES